MITITSRQNPRVKAAARLRDRRDREKQGRILIDGARELHRAIGAGLNVSEVFFCEPLCTGGHAERLLPILPDCGAELFQVAEPIFRKLAFGQRADGVLGVAEMPRRKPADLHLPAMPLVAVLEGVEKPGNVGAVLRTADAVGLSAVIVAEGRTDLYNPNAIRASLGTIFTVPVSAGSTAETLDWLRDAGLALCAAQPDGSVPYSQADFRRPTAIVLGSEAHGLSDAWRGPEITTVCLPMLGLADSLNVSATAAVLFYEAVRQRAGD